MMHLSPHFTFQELTRTDTGLPNEPTEAIRERLIALAETLEQVRGCIGDVPIVIHSGYRSPDVNTAVGGSKTSAHCLGYAVDFSAPKFGSASAICRVIAMNPVLKFDQLIDEARGGARWVHLSIDPRRRRQVLTFRNGVYTAGLPA